MSRIHEITTSYRDELVNRLRAEPEYGIGYLNAALEEGHGAFLVALRDIIDARFGMTEPSKRTEIDRVLSTDKDPRLATLEKVLAALGLHLSIVPNSAGQSPAAAD